MPTLLPQRVFIDILTTFINQQAITNKCSKCLSRTRGYNRGPAWDMQPAVKAVESLSCGSPPCIHRNTSVVPLTEEYTAHLERRQRLYNCRQTRRALIWLTQVERATAQLCETVLACIQVFVGFQRRQGKSFTQVTTNAWHQWIWAHATFVLRNHVCRWCMWVEVST